MRKGTPHPTASDTPSVDAPAAPSSRDQAKRLLRSKRRGDDQFQTVANDDPTLSDLTSLIRFSSAAISLISFSSPIPCDVDAWTFSNALYTTPSRCLQANLRLARAHAKEVPEELLGCSLVELFPESLGFREMFQVWHHHHLSRDGFEWHTTDSTGKTTTLHVACYGHIVENGLHRLWIITRDISKRVQNSRSMANTERHFRSLLEQPGVLFLRSYEDGTLAFFTEQTREALSIHDDTEHTVDAILAARCHPGDRQTIEQLAFQRHLRSTTPLRTSLRLITEKRGLRSYSIHQLPYQTSNDIHFYDTVAVEQSTEERHPPPFLLSGLTHDANNHLLIASANIQKAERALGEGHPALEPLRAALSALSQTSAIHTQVRQLQDGVTPQPANLDVGEVFQDVITECKAALPTTMRLTTTVEPGAIYVRMDPTHLRQVLANLILNARDAMQGHSSITLSATLKGKDVLDRCTLPCEKVVCISVSDNGPGIELPILETIFKPFVSTKRSSTPRGLGLAMVKDLIERNNGQVSATSAQGIGSTFTLCLPAGTRTAPSGVAIASLAPSIFRPLNVLVADDEAHVRQVFDGALSSRGHLVTLCKDGSSLLEKLTKESHGVDVVIVDDGMPGSSGGELVRAIQRLRSDIPVIVVSGDPLAAMRVHESASSAHFLAKPFTLEQLYATVESLAEQKHIPIPIVPLGGKKGRKARTSS
ncbi:MAG: hypothetical protein RL518_2704 [Pseudomonadota bacterium]